MAAGEDFHLIVDEETAALRSKYALTPAGKTDRAVRMQNTRVFVDFWYDRARNHFAQADVGLLQNVKGLRDTYSDYEIATFYQTDRWDYHPQGKPIGEARDGRLLIRPQVRATAAMLVATADRLFAGDVEEFVHLHYFSSGYNAHHTETVSKPKQDEPPQQTPKRPPVGAYVVLSLLIGMLLGAVAEHFDLWKEIPALRELLQPR